MVQPVYFLMVWNELVPTHLTNPKYLLTLYNAACKVSFSVITNACASRSRWLDRWPKLGDPTIVNDGHGFWAKLTHSPSKKEKEEINLLPHLKVKTSSYLLRDKSNSAACILRCWSFLVSLLWLLACRIVVRWRYKLVGGILIHLWSWRIRLPENVKEFVSLAMFVFLPFHVPFDYYLGRCSEELEFGSSVEYKLLVSVGEVEVARG